VLLICSSADKDFVDALPGGKRKVGYAYQILDPVSEEAGPSVRPVVPAGTLVTGDLRGTATPQLGSITGTGRKRSAPLPGLVIVVPYPNVWLPPPIFHQPISTSRLAMAQYQHYTVIPTILPL
jgi:hypothetical protein